MPATLTQEQQRALTHRTTSIALDAGAGCGKTHVLTERFLSHLDRKSADAPNPAELRQLIAITFTDAAAREMRRRIRTTCRDRMRQAADAEDHEGEDYWHEMLRAIETARVSTIHAFCNSLLRRHAITASLEPTFAVLDQGAADVLQSQMVDDVLRRQLSAHDPGTLDLVAAFNLNKVKEQIRELLEHRHDSSFNDWLDKSPEDLLTVWRSCFSEAAFTAAVADLAALPHARTICELLSQVQPENPKFAQAKQTLLDRLPRLGQSPVSRHELSDLVQSVGVSGICRKEDWNDPDQFEAYKKACASLREKLNALISMQFDEQAAREAATLGLSLLRLTQQVAHQYDRQKITENKLDFDDLLARAYDLLRNPAHAAVRNEITQDLKLLLVDEFQDTNEQQVAFVKLLCGERFDDGKLFFVGDFKQSIYRFRGAQPEVFSGLQSEVPEPGRLPLDENFRSQPAILHFVNALFADAFDNYRPLRPHRAQVTAEPSVEFLWAITPNKSNPGIKGAAHEARVEEARRIARRVCQLREAEALMISDAASKSGIRPLQLRDVAILFRTLSSVDVYEAALRDYELDYYVVGGHAFYSQQEIYDVLNLLRAVATPADEIALAGVLRSPFFSLFDETLYWLKESGDTLNNGLLAAGTPPELSIDERLKVNAAADTLQFLRGRKDLVPIATLLGDALARTGYDAALLPEFLGERKLANLQKIMEQARAADRSGALDLAGFIAQLSEFVAREPKEALAATLSESADVVRLMTIHHAKGLEFPLVIVPDLDRKENSDTSSAAFSAELGPLVPLPDADDRDGAVTGIKLHRILEKQAELAERKRLLYVATTRAKDHLILSSSLAGYDKLQSDWTRFLGERFDLQTGNLRAQLPAGFASPHVAATDKEPTTNVKAAGRSRGPDLVHLLADAHDLAASGRGLIPPGVASIAVDASARRQFSVSRLTGKLMREDAWTRHLLQRPIAAAAGEVEPLELGRLVHAVMERLQLRGENPIRYWCEQLAPEHVLINATRAATLARRMVEQFAASARWQQLADAKIVYRELDFLLAWPPGKTSGDDGQYLQGYIDCLYQDPDGRWHLLDYKSNDVSAAASRDEAARYEMQMVVYALAAEHALGQSPVELALHFLRPGVEHILTWDDAARRRGVELVNDAIALAQTQPLNSQL